MIRLFVTGDVHIGKKYDRYPDIRELLIQSRFDCLDRAVREAEREGCDFFVITGDLFDNINAIRVQDVKKTVEILSGFSGRVLVLPGNHDYYTGGEKVWQSFAAQMANTENNICLLKEQREYPFDVMDEKVIFYPAPCDSKHSKENRIGWVGIMQKENADYHIGIAHGSIAGISPDLKNEYYLMTENELNRAGVDAWLIGHTHIQYPPDLKTEEETAGFRIFNAGTPEQTDLSNRTDGSCFIIRLDRETGDVKVCARRFVSGSVRFFDLEVNAGSEAPEDLKGALQNAVRDLPPRSVIRAKVSGTVDEEEYNGRNDLYESAFGSFLTYEIDDNDLSEKITRDKIRSEFAETGFAAEFLERLDDPKELQMAYELIKRHQA